MMSQQGWPASWYDPASQPQCICTPLYCQSLFILCVLST